MPNSRLASLLAERVLTLIQDTRGTTGADTPTVLEALAQAAARFVGEGLEHRDLDALHAHAEVFGAMFATTAEKLWTEERASTRGSNKALH